MKQTYKIPVTRIHWGIVQVQAESLTEAASIVLDNDLKPDSTKPIDDTVVIDMEGLQIYNKVSDEEMAKFKVESTFLKETE